MTTCQLHSCGQCCGEMWLSLQAVGCIGGCVMWFSTSAGNAKESVLATMCSVLSFCSFVRSTVRDLSLPLFVHASVRLPSRQSTLNSIVDTADGELQQWLLQHCGPDVALANILRGNHDRAYGLIDQCYQSLLDAWSSLSALAGVWR